MTAETRGHGPTDTLPNIHGLTGTRVEPGLWVYGNLGFLKVRDGKLIPADTARTMKMAPQKPSMFSRRPDGWNVYLNVFPVGGSINCVVERDGVFGTLYALSEGEGRVVEIPIGERAKHLGGEGKEYAFMPVQTTKNHKGGILVVETNVLQKEQNQGRIKGFLRII